jgi:hypothetical protein
MAAQSGSSDQFGANVSIAQIVFAEAQLRRILKACALYYNQVRTHLSLDKDAPDSAARSQSATSPHCPCSAGSIINTSGFEF